MQSPLRRRVSPWRRGEAGRQPVAVLFDDYVAYFFFRCCVDQTVIGVANEVERAGPSVEGTLGVKKDTGCGVVYMYQAKIVSRERFLSRRSLEASLSCMVVFYVRCEGAHWLADRRAQIRAISGERRWNADTPRLSSTERRACTSHNNTTGA